MSKGPKTLDAKQTQTSTQTTKIDPTLMARQNELWGRALGLANTPYQMYTGQRFAGFTPDQLASFDATRGAVASGNEMLGQARDIAGGVGGFQAPQVDYQDAGTFQAGPASLLDPTAGQVSAGTGPGGYQAYMDPYLNDVVSGSLGDIERARREAQQQTRSQAAAAGAFGGSRSGVAEALTNRDYGSLAARTAAGLRSTGFNTALGFNQADQNRALQAGIANQNTAAQVGLANQGARNQLNLFNAGQQQQGAQFNAGNRLNLGLANASNAINAGNLRLGAAGLLGDLSSRGLAGAAALNAIGTQQQEQDQRSRDFDYQQFDEARQFPYQNLDMLSRILYGGQYGNTISGSSSGTSSQTNPNRGSFLNNLLGAGLTFAGIPGAGRAVGGLFGGGRRMNGTGEGMGIW